MALKPDAAARKDLTTGKDTLQHRHLATIATCLRNMNADAATVARWADELAPTNPKFDRARFIKACGDAAPASDELFVELVDEHGDRYWSGTYGGDFGLESTLYDARSDCSMELRSTLGIENSSLQVRALGPVLSVHPFKEA